ncbi:hypothetical protein [Actinopolyspora lacussalsi]|uniref:hypothetical protein n=1 Tax=Actinopolyspora righensis TaxID=995060 RepID=UPI00111382D9|nr:hypothetical protein [Actinopolyspora righensis]
MTDRPATQEHICVAGTQRKEVAYAADNPEKPQETRYVEELDSEKIEKFNEQLVDAGNDPLPEDATNLEFRTDVSVIVHLSDGATQTRHGHDGTAEESDVHPMGG